MHFSTIGRAHGVLNGQAPQGKFASVLPDVNPVPDIAWDGCIATEDADLANCLYENGDATYIDLDCFGDNRSTDIAAVTCQHDELPTQQW